MPIGEILKQKHRVIFALTVLFLCVNLAYTFIFCDYHALVWGDMKQFWLRAEAFLKGDYFSVDQWSVWPVFYHIFLSFQMRIADLIGLHNYRLEWVLFFGIALNASGVFFIYNIAETISKTFDSLKLPNHIVAFIAAFLYAVSFPHIHLNAYVLSESYALPAMMGAFYFVICCRRSVPSLIIAGTLFGLSVIIRPALGMLGLIFVGILYIEKASIFGWLRQCFLFTVFFALVVGGGSLVTGYMSGWRLVKPGGNGALVFYIHHCNPNVWAISNKAFLKKGESFNHCKPYQISKPPYSDMVTVKGLTLEDFRGCNGMIYGQPPALMLKSKHEDIASQLNSEPPWNSSYYWKKSFQCIEREGWSRHFVEHTMMFMNIFEFIFYPNNEFIGPDKNFTTTGSLLYLLLTMWIDCFVAMSFFAPYMIHSKGKGRRYLFVLSGVPIILLATSYLFAIDSRYLVPAMFTGYIAVAVYIMDSLSYKKSMDGSGVSRV